MLLQQQLTNDLNTVQCVMTIVVSSVTPLTDPDTAHGEHVAAAER